jgi:hypothetical protein
MSDPDREPLATVEQGNADEADIQEQVDSASEVPELEPEVKDPAAVALGRRGGLKGGAARAKSLTAAQRKEAAKKAAEARWSKKS